MKFQKFAIWKINVSGVSKNLNMNEHFLPTAR
jgi:hypothetical protein